jgi:hypothetical protein
MSRNPFVSFASPGRVHLSLRTLVANDNAPPAADPPRHADGGASTRWPLLARLRGRRIALAAADADDDADVRLWASARR